MGDMDDVVREFLVESNENLDQLDRDLVTLEKDPTAEEVLASIFRTIHTIKGTSGFLGFTKLEALTHVGENLISRLRDRRLGPNAEITSGLLALVDAVRRILSYVEGSGQEGPEDYTAVAELLTRLQEGKPAVAAPAPPPATRGESAPPSAPEEEETEEENTTLGQMLVQAGQITPQDLAAALKQQQDGDPRRIGEILVGQGAVVPDVVLQTIEDQREVRTSAVSESNIRVDVGMLDKLMNLVGELVLARNQILQFSTTQQDTAFLNTSQRLNLITTELQEGVMKTRMQPIGNIWSKFPRVVRDLALACGKKVRIEMEGKQTDLDKTIIEAIKDPLTHLVRNVVDHGIEAPKVRAARGKPAEGRLSLRAYHEGGQVNIEISDDGAGIDLGRVKDKAVERGLITREQAAHLSDREALNLIFLPGLSTAEKVTNVSGRGVGMDVVKTNIEKIGGIFDIQTKPGEGTTFKIKIPLTLAIIPALIVTTAGDRYAIPQVSLLELVRLEGEQARKGIEKIQDAPVYRLRGRLLPLVYLNRELRAANQAQAGDGGSKGDSPGGKGLNGKVRQLETIDFALARSKHKLWLPKLRDMLSGKATIDPEQAGAFRNCALGKWLYGPGLEEFGDIPEMRELEKVHARFHGMAKGIVMLKASGEDVRAQRELAALEAFSSEIISLIEQVERKVARAHSANIVVLRADDRQFGLVVDEINDTEEIVVKPLGKQLKGISTFAGATIMGDGHVALILDVLGLAQRAAVVAGTRDRARAEQARDAQQQAEERAALLLFRTPDDGRMAIPLSLVSRLEEFSGAALERIGGQQVVQYRDEILPLIPIAQIVPERRQQPRSAPETVASAEGSKVQVVVYSAQGKSVGLVVDRILDIVEEQLTVKSRSGRPGTLGSAVIQGKVTELIDVDSVMRATGPLSPGASILREARA